MTTDCPSEDDLVRLVEGALADASLASIEQHLDGCEACAALVAELGALRPATARAVGRYQLDRRIAAGGMGEVWAAWDPTLRRDIAVKLVRPDRADDGRERERLLREARALARLQHPNVLAVYDVGLADGDVFLATELVAGDTLANRGGATSDWRALARLYAQAARGLAAAHAAGLVHRDVKPANLLLGADGRVRVADFGLAVRAATPTQALPDGAAGDPQVTASGHVAGTPAYMAPEQRLGSPADARADQFALCLALVEGIDGRRPAADLGTAALIDFISARRPRDAALDELCAVLARGLSGISDERHADMSALADAIERISAGETGEVAITSRESPATLLGTPAPSTDRRATIAPTRDRANRMPLIIVAIAVAASLLALAAWQLLRTKDAPLVTPIAISTSNPLTSNPATSNPSTTNPSTTNRSTTNPSTTNPSTTNPSTTNPSTTNPSTTNPSTTNPSTTNRSTSGPSPAHSSGGSAPSTAPSSTHPPRPSAPAPTTPSTSPPSTVSVDAAMDELAVAVKHRDARRCRDIADAIDVNALDREEVSTVEMLHARCEMIGGDCAGGARRVEAVYKRATAASAVATAVQFETDSFCPVTGDTATVKRRLLAQTTHMMIDPNICRIYVAPARQLATAASTELDKRVAGSVIVAIAKCFSSARKCDDAHALLREADALVAGLDNPGELTSACH